MNEQTEKIIIWLCEPNHTNASSLHMLQGNDEGLMHTTPPDQKNLCGADVETWHNRADEIHILNTTLYYHQKTDREWSCCRYHL